IGLLELALGLDQGRPVRIAVQRDPGRRQLGYGIQRTAEALDRLFGQAGDQIHAHRPEALRTGRIDDHRRFLGRLDAIDGLLDLAVEVLHADAHAVEAEFGQHRHRFRIDLARVDLDRVFAVRRQGEMAAYAGHQFAHLRMREEGRRAAAPVQLHDFVRALQLRRLHGDFLADILDVLVRVRLVLGDDLVAGAVVANRIAERDMYV